MPITTTARAVCCADLRAAAGSRQAGARVTATLTISAPLATHRRARARQVGRHAVEVVVRQDDAPAAGLRSMQVGEAARATRGRRTRRRASSASARMRAALVLAAVEAAAFPVGRQVTMTGLATARPARRRRRDRAPCRGAARPGRRRAPASRPRRSSAIVAAVTVTQSLAGFIASVPTKTKTPLQPVGLKRRFGRASSAVVVVTTRPVASSAGHQYHQRTHTGSPIRPKDGCWGAVKTAAERM